MALLRYAPPMQQSDCFVRVSDMCSSCFWVLLIKIIRIDVNIECFATMTSMHDVDLKLLGQ
jgi:hypothetical protein